MSLPDTVEVPSTVSAELHTTFAALAPLLSQATSDADKVAKRPKINHNKHKDEPDQTKELIVHLASMVLRLDHECQQMRKQDSFIFYMQMEPEGVIHDLIKTGKQWHQEVQNSTQMQTTVRQPLRMTLAQTMVGILKSRLEKMMLPAPQDGLFKAAIQTGILNSQGEFFYHRWDPAQKKLSDTDQAPVPMARMMRYVQQLEELLKDREAIQKFHALRAPNGGLITPWVMQISLRMDDLHVVMSTLCGSKIWNVLGASVKAHSLNNSPQGVRLQQMLGKGKGRGKGKHKTA